MAVYLLVGFLGAGIRYLLSESPYLEERPEISNPTNSWKRLVEGIHLNKLGVSPYDGVMYHESPLLLTLFSTLESVMVERFSTLTFIIGDLLTCAVLARLGRVAATRFLDQQLKEKRTGVYHPEARSILIRPNLDSTLPKTLVISYLFNPFIIVNCAARTSTVWSNLLLSLTLLGQAECVRWAGCLALALATYQTLYPVILLAPLAIQIAQHEGCGWNRAGVKSVLGTVLLFLVFLGGLLVLSCELCGGSWRFLSSTYGFVVSVPELTPNMGIFWYFFTEMFEHFRTFFLATFQVNLAMYCLPLSIRFSAHPLLLSVLMLGLIAVFKSYPGLGDVGFFLSLIPIFSHLLPFLKQTFVIGGMMLATTLLAPIAHHLWIYNNSANANYYFAINLVFSTAQIFLITDLLFAQVKRDFYLEHGHTVVEKEVDGKKHILQLK